MEAEAKIDDPFTASLKVGCVASHFLDSGAFTLWVQAKKYAAENGGSLAAYYDTKEARQYLKRYAKFVTNEENACAIDLYANVDVIGNPELTYRNQKILEDKYGLTPVPVVHFKTDLKWLRKYIDEGYELIGLGGLVGSTAQDGCQAWIDRCFEIACDTPDRLPCVKLHGFGVTSYKLMLRYPWYSVDSTSWTKIGAYGGIMVPHKRKGKFVFDEQPYLIKCSQESEDRKLLGRHYLTLTSAEKKIIKEWLDEIGILLGKLNSAGEITEYGVLTRHMERRAANLLFYEKMLETIPPYPWVFHSSRRQGFGIC